MFRRGRAFFDGDNIYLGTSDGLLISTDGGASFASAKVGGLAAGQGIASFAGAKANGVTRLFCVTLASRDLVPGAMIEGAVASDRLVYSLDIGKPKWTAQCHIPERRDAGLCGDGATTSRRSTRPAQTRRACPS